MLDVQAAKKIEEERIARRAAAKKERLFINLPLAISARACLQYFDEARVVYCCDYKKIAL